jgi:hypothetical protein
MALQGAPRKRANIEARDAHSVTAGDTVQTGDSEYAPESEVPGLHTDENGLGSRPAVHPFDLREQWERILAEERCEASR